MSIEETHTGDVTIFKIDGDLSGQNATEFRTMVGTCLDEGHRDFMVDLTNVHGCDSAGLEVLTWLQRECENRLGLLRLCAISDVMKKVLEITRLQHQFENDGF